MELKDVVVILKDEKTFFDKAAKQSFEEKNKTKLRSLKSFHKGKSQAYMIASDCINDVIDLLEQYIKITEEADNI